MCQSANPFCSPPRRPSFSSFSNALPYNPLPVEVVDRLMEKTEPQVPKHLRRVLFVPKHTSSVTHLPIYDVSETYWARMRGAVFASHAYKIDLMFLQRPRGDGDAEVCFFANFDPQQRQLTLETRGAAAEKGDIVTVTLPAAPLDRATLTMPDGRVCHVHAHLDGASSGGQQVATTPGYRAGPRLSMESANRGAEGAARWDVRPEDAGSLCYSVRAAGDADAKAVYHHAGSHLEHPRAFSEGVVLMPTAADDAAPGDTLTALALLSVLLWHIRGLRDEPNSPVEALFRKLRTKMGAGEDGQ